MKSAHISSLEAVPHLWEEDAPPEVVQAVGEKEKEMAGELGVKCEERSEEPMK